MPERLFYVAFGIDSEDSDAKSYFVSEDRKSVEAWVENGGKRPSDPATAGEETARPEKPRRDVATRSATKVDSFSRITKHFLHSMNKLDQIIPKTMFLLPLAERTEMNLRFYRPLAKATTRIAKSEQFEIYECGLEHLRLLERARRDLWALRNGRTSLPGMFLMGLVSSYDAFLSNLLHLIFLTKPEMLSSSERNISFKDLVELGSIDAARNQMIEKEIETVLRQSHHAQFDSLEAKLGIPLRKDLAIWPKFVEICERRNLFTHTDGVVSRQYLQVCTDHKVELNRIAVGDQLTISRKYLREALDVISELGWKLIQVVWRKLKPSEIGAAAWSLNDEAYELLCRRRFQLARTMLEFGLSFKKQGEEVVRKMMVVNLAIAVKSLGNVEEAYKILDGEDWSAASDKFKICVAAVRNDIDSVVKYIAKIAESEVSKGDFREWPAFRSIRNDPKFITSFEQRFGEAFLPDRGSADVGEMNRDERPTLALPDNTSSGENAETEALDPENSPQLQ